MKHIRIILLFVIVLLCVSNACAQGIKIYKTDGSTINIPYSELDSIVNVPGREFVDIGLSVRWASCNVGAESPEEYGEYFAWGEILPKISYTKENCLTDNKKIADITGNADYDAASANWDVSARIPTNLEINELCEKCSWQYKTYNGVGGMLITGPNGNSIFLPAAGFCLGSSLFGVGEKGYYWSSVPFAETQDAYYLDFDKNYYYWGSWIRRYIGQPVRPVSDCTD